MDVPVACGHPVTEEDQILYLLGGVSLKYDSIVVHVTSRVDKLSFYEIEALLLSHEAQLESFNSLNENTTHMVNTTTTAPQQKIQNQNLYQPSRFSPRRRGRGRYFRGGGCKGWQQNHNRPVCQICGVQP